MNVPHRKRYNNSGGSNNNYRSRPNNNNNNNNRQRSNNTGGGNTSNFGPPRPRKNFRALQEKYLNMAKEAMGSGDRILAEYYLQHADHYHRENEAFLEERNKWHESRAQKRTDNPQPTDEQEAAADLAEDDAHDDSDGGDVEDDVDLSSSGSALPAFLTRKVSAKDAAKIAPIQDWAE